MRLTSQVSNIRIDTHLWNDTPAVECLAICAVCPADAGVGVRVEEASVVQLLLCGILKLFGVCGE